MSQKEPLKSGSFSLEIASKKSRHILQPQT